MKFDLGFGYATCVKESLISSHLMPGNINSNKMDYPSQEAKNELISLIRSRTKEWWGSDFKYISLVNGAMNGLDLICRVSNPDSVTFHKDHFAYYHSLGGYTRTVDFKDKEKLYTSNDMYIVDSPNNPTGDFLNPDILDGVVVWDAVYHNPVYCKAFSPYKRAEFVVGSFGKMFGISGIRLGFVLTDNVITGMEIDNMVETVQCGLNSVSIDIATRVMKNDLTGFFTKARYNIDCNKEELSKLKMLLDGETPSKGMFYYPEADSRARNILTNAGVVFMPGSTTGSGGRIRLNMCADRELTRKAVRAVLRKDKI